MNEQMTITVEFTEDSIFGPDAENREGVDVHASIANYAQTLTAKLQQEYPDAKITVENTINDRHQINGEYDHEEIAWLGDIIHDHWESWDWVVKN